MGKRHSTPGGVRVHVKGRNLTIAPTLYDRIVQKMGRLDKYLDRLNDIEVELWTEKSRAAAHHNHAEATARVLGRTIRVASSGAEMHVAVDGAVDKLYRQLNRTKERVKSHHGATRLVDSTPETGYPVLPPSPDDVNGQPAEPVIMVEHLDMKPLFEDEALSEMEQQEREFLVFLNAHNEEVNVLYRHSDGTYGLIKPRVR